MPEEVKNVIQQRIRDIEDSKPKLYHCDACNEDVLYPKVHEIRCSKFFLLGLGDRKIRLISTNKE